MFGHGFELITSRHLSVRVWRERDTFSGGVNLSARERNAKRIADSQRVYVMGNKIIGSPENIQRVAQQLGRNQS